MPGLPSTLRLGTLLDRSSSATNASTDPLQVICAWPLSGQYGPGSRALFYAFVLTSIFGRKTAWLKAACFAATLLFPAVSAIHGIVLAAAHVNGAVDMDIYGAFQTCSIGIMAAPVTLKMSKTYFHKASRNIIFLWAILVLAGLLSLTVEFYRVTTSNCTSDDQGGKFLYGGTTCGLRCSTNEGPYSSIRSGSTNNIYVIPAPTLLTFGLATLFAAASCIPAILMLMSLWNLSLESNWKARFEYEDELIEGTNGATVRHMGKVETTFNLRLSALEVPLSLAIVLTNLIIGEKTFFSEQVYYQTEPMSSIGQWAPIVGTGFALLVGFVQGRLDEDGETVPREDLAGNSGPGVAEGSPRLPSAMRTSTQSAPSRPLSTILRMQPLERPIATLPADLASFELQNLPSTSALGSLENRPRRRHSLQAPPPSLRVCQEPIACETPIHLLDLTVPNSSRSRT